MISVKVIYRNDDGDVVVDNEVSRIFVAVETEQAIVLSVETATKYPHPDAYVGGCGVTFRTKSKHWATVSVEGVSFDNPQVIAETSRYGMFIAVFPDVSQQSRQVYP